MNFIDLNDIKIPKYVHSKKDCEANYSNWLWETFQLLSHGDHPDYLIECIKEYLTNSEIKKCFFKLEQSVYENGENV